MRRLVMRLRRKAARLAFVLVGFLAGGIAGEVLLRLFVPQTLGLRWYTREGIMVNVPHLRTTYARPEYATRIEIDSDGLRDREYAPGKPEGVYRILLLGDSYAEALQVESEVSFPKRVEALLAGLRPGMRIEIVNAGIAGYGTADELRYLEAYGARWQPDLVLVAFYCGNDVRNNIAETGMRREGGKLHVARKPLTSWQYHVKGIRNWMAAHSHLWQFVRARLTLGGSAGEPAKPSGGVPGAVKAWSERPFEDYDDRDAMRKNPGPIFTRGWKLTQELIVRIGETAGGLGSSVAIVAIPSRWQVDAAFLASRVGPASVADGTYDSGRPGRLVCDFAAQSRMPCLDLAPLFQASGADASWYWKIDSHFTPKAHEVAARTIASFLVEQVGVPDSSAAPAPAYR